MQTSDMQEKKNKRRVLLLVLLVISTGFLYRIRTQEKAAHVDKDIFHPEDYKRIDKIILESVSGKTELSFGGARWKVNNRYDADRKLISFLFATLQHAEPKRMVAASLRDSLSSALEKNGIKVSLYEGQSSVRTFYAGGNTTKTRSYFKDPSDNNIYLMAVPGYHVYVSGILELTENQWRDKYAFGFNWRNFKSLQVSFPDKPSEDFKVSMGKGNYFDIEGMAKADTARLNSFLDEVSLLTVNEYIIRKNFTDSLKNIKPLMIITASDIANRDYSLKLFRERGSDVAGLLNDGEAVIFNRLKIRSIARPRSFFKSK